MVVVVKVGEEISGLLSHVVISFLALLPPLEKWS
jgi:hypothetical protein